MTSSARDIRNFIEGTNLQLKSINESIEGLNKNTDDKYNKYIEFVTEVNNNYRSLVSTLSTMQPSTVISALNSATADDVKTVEQSKEHVIQAMNTLESIRDTVGAPSVETLAPLNAAVQTIAAASQVNDMSELKLEIKALMKAFAETQSNIQELRRLIDIQGLAFQKDIQSANTKLVNAATQASMLPNPNQDSNAELLSQVRQSNTILRDVVGSLNTVIELVSPKQQNDLNTPISTISDIGMIQESLNKLAETVKQQSSSFSSVIDEVRKKVAEPSPSVSDVLDAIKIISENSTTIAALKALNSQDLDAINKKLALLAALPDKPLEVYIQEEISKKLDGPLLQNALSQYGINASSIVDTVRQIRNEVKTDMDTIAKQIEQRNSLDKDAIQSINGLPNLVICS